MGAHPSGRHPPRPRPRVENRPKQPRKPTQVHKPRVKRKSSYRQKTLELASKIPLTAENLECCGKEVNSRPGSNRIGEYSSAICLSPAVSALLSVLPADSLPLKARLVLFTGTRIKTVSLPAVAGCHCQELSNITPVTKIND